ncbi:MAG: glycosyltransferase family 39 protein [Melioribacteraceae bacterium]|nr:glycosyltransferase family 39 protein [Melioribacteraceae bacterium]MCF8355514.1 glycosyltransferase family 39 protein [Melioribacteraceae bacterium]MCF8394202.1 glycosyltransferase family 39 protein [Melioribacteraceae bacterium]MCF8419922.1 glycosyltransferase family 39 protein [Melioribacteraceae bacterium]
MEIVKTKIEYYITKLKVLSKTAKLVLLTILTVLFLGIFTYYGFGKNLWLDELFSIQVIDQDAPKQIITKLYLGADTNAPLYFVFLKFYSDIFGSSDFSLKIFSLTCVFLSLIILYRVFRNFGFNESDILLVLFFLILSQAISTYLLVEIRAYSLYFLLSTLTVLIYLRSLASDSVTDYFHLIFINTALLYTHYFSFFLISAITIYEVLFHRRKKYFLSLLFSFLLFSVWIPAVLNQYSIGKGLVHHSIPSVIDVVFSYRFLIGFGGIIILFTSLIYLVFIEKKRELNRILVFGIILSIPPFLNIIFSKVGISVHSPRYFIFSLIGLSIILLYTINKLQFKIKIILIIILTALGVNRVLAYSAYIYENRKYVEKLNEKSLIDFPLVTESPHIYYPIDHYNEKQDVFFLLDSLSAFANGNIKNAPYDYYLLKNYKRFYFLPNILPIDNFLKIHKKFFLINENERMLYEVRFKNNSKYEITKMDSIIYKIETNEI